MSAKHSGSTGPDSPPVRAEEPEVVYGFHPVRELLRHRPHDVIEVWAAARRGNRRAELEELCLRHGVTLRDARSSELSELANGPHNGFLARVRRGSDAGGAGDRDLVVLVEDVQDPRNLGALLRVCEGAGVGRVLIRDRGSAPITPVVAKTAAGATEWLEVERIANTGQELERLKKDGYWVYGAVGGGGEPPWAIDLTGKVVLCFGGEEKGLRQRTRELCDGTIGLPMRGRVGSLNLATAAAAVLYDAVRQRD